MIYKSAVDIMREDDERNVKKLQSKHLEQK